MVPGICRPPHRSKYCRIYQHFRLLPGLLYYHSTGVTINHILGRQYPSICNPISWCLFRPCRRRRLLLSSGYHWTRPSANRSLHDFVNLKVLVALASPGNMSRSWKWTPSHPNRGCCSDLFFHKARCRHVRCHQWFSDRWRYFPAHCPTASWKHGHWMDG